MMVFRIHHQKYAFAACPESGVELDTSFLVFIFNSNLLTVSHHYNRALVFCGWDCVACTAMVGTKL